MKEENIVIGIEGLVGSGKTSICREMLRRDFDARPENTLVATMDGKGQFFCQKKEDLKE